MPCFEERQTFGLFAYAVVLAVPAVLAVSPLVSGMPLLPVFALVGIMLCVVLPIANLLFMVTIVTEETLEVRFGYVIPFYRKTFALSEVQLEGAVTYRPILDAGGWGIRWGRFDGKSCRFLNARGNQGVLICTPKSRFIIGSQAPDALAQALKEPGC